MSRKQISDSFTESYEALNQAQRKAVDTVDGPVMVIAGPGTGKTQILTLRIVQILRLTDTSPEQILALTFTDSGASAMRTRLRKYLGSDAYRVPIYTFHGFADMLIRSYPDVFARIVGGTPLTDIEKISYMQKIIVDGAYSALRPVGNPEYYVRALLQQIATMKREYITPTTLQTIVATQEETMSDTPQYHESGAHKGKVRGEYTKLEKQLRKNQELLSVYQTYEALLREDRRYDFEDMILEAVYALQTDETLLRELQEMYQYVLADEHQDVNESQNKILELLANYHNRPNIFVVGDEKQAIYRFQGASLANFLYFSDRFTGVVTIDLTTNYRSGQEILDASQCVIATDDPALKDLRVPLTAETTDVAKVAVRSFSHQVTEEAWLVAAVQECIQSGTPPEEVAIMVRTNQSVEHITHYLRSHNIPVQASADGDINHHPITQSVRSLIRAVTQPEQEAALATLLHAPFWHIAASDVMRVCAARSLSCSLAQIVSDETKLQSLSLENPESVLRVHTVIQSLREASVTRLPHQVLEMALHESGLLTHVHAQDPLEGGRVVRRLYDTVERHVQSGEVRTLADVDRWLGLYDSYNIALSAPYITINQHAVQVMTAHKAKGLEYEIVFAPYLTDNAWGGKRRREQFAVPLTQTSGVGDESDDDRRLLYVLMTRAKRMLHLSYATNSTEGKERSLSRLLDPLMTIDSVGWPSTADFEAQVTLSETIPYQTLAAIQAPVLDVTTVRTLLAERGLSATSINNYRSSPWNYFYRNILRWPELPTLSLRFGTIIHACLEHAVVTAGDGTATVPSVSDLQQYLAGQLQQQPVTAAEYAQLHEKGLSALAIYRAHLQEQLSSVTRSRVELPVRVVLDTNIAELPELPLTGKLDRVDYDESGRIVQVVDYKTGKPKTRNAIEGKTAKSDGAYKYQLCFYAVLLAEQGLHHPDLKYTLSFVEPDAHGKVREETFYISDEEVTQTRADICAIAEDIASGKFLTMPCDSAVSDYCDLVAALRSASEK